jgi:hypothetical protein
MVLRSTQPLTEMSTRNLPGGGGVKTTGVWQPHPHIWADCLENVGATTSQTKWATTAHYRDNFTLSFTDLRSQENWNSFRCGQGCSWPVVVTVPFSIPRHCVEISSKGSYVKHRRKLIKFCFESSVIWDLRFPYFTFRAVPTYPIVQSRISQDRGISSRIISFEWDLTPSIQYYFHVNTCKEICKNIFC